MTDSDNQNNEETWVPRGLERPTLSAEGASEVEIRQRFVLNDTAGTTLFRRLAVVPEAPHAGDLRRDFMESIAHELMEAQQDGNHPLCVHGSTENGRRGHFVIPLDSIAYVGVEMVDAYGDLVHAKPGYLHHEEPEAGNAQVTDIGRRPPTVRNLRRNDPTLS